MYDPPRDCKRIVRPRELFSIPLSLNGRDHARSIEPFDPPAADRWSIFLLRRQSATPPPYLRFGDTKRNAMTEQRFRVGIVGLEPGRGWAARAHVPALRALC